MARQERSDVGRGRRSAFGARVATNGLSRHCPCDVPGPVHSGLRYMEPRPHRQPVRRISNSIRRWSFQHTKPRRDQRGKGVTLLVIVDVFRMRREFDIPVVGSVNDMRCQPVGTDIVAVSVEGPADDIEAKEQHQQPAQGAGGARGTSHGDAMQRSFVHRYLVMSLNSATASAVAPTRLAKARSRQ